MAQNSMKGTMAFQDTIRTYLDNMAESDALFAVKYANPSKSLSECITYIICQVVVNHTVELTEEEKEQARQDAIAKLRDEEASKMRRPSQSKKATENRPQVEQRSLFDF